MTQALVKPGEVWPEAAWLSSMRPDGGKFRRKAKYGYYYCEESESINPADYDLNDEDRTAVDRTLIPEPEPEPEPEPDPEPEPEGEGEGE